MTLAGIRAEISRLKLPGNQVRIAWPAQFCHSYSR
jgi:hypothetical protein